MPTLGATSLWFLGFSQICICLHTVVYMFSKLPYGHQPARTHHFWTEFGLSVLIETNWGPVKSLVHLDPVLCEGEPRKHLVVDMSLGVGMADERQKLCADISAEIAWIQTFCGLLLASSAAVQQWTILVPPSHPLFAPFGHSFRTGGSHPGKVFKGSYFEAGLWLISASPWECDLWSLILAISMERR